MKVKKKKKALKVKTNVKAGSWWNWPFGR